MLKTNLYFLAACLLVATGTAIAADAASDVLVKSTVEEVLTVIKQNKDKRALRDLAEQKVLPHFDFRHMTQLAVSLVPLHTLHAGCPMESICYRARVG